MKKYLATITFEWNEAAMQLIPDHRAYINDLIDEGQIEHYAVSMEVQTIWVTLNAENKIAARRMLNKSPFHKFWKVQLHELMIWDGQNYRLPVVQLN
jgi:hypothetical protein